MRWWMMMSLIGVGCSAEIIEGPLEGPGVDGDAVTVGGDELVVALTHLQVRNAPGPGRRFGEHADAVGTYLFAEEPEGWVGAAFRNVGRLDWWTMTVWESEDSMAEFVISEPHSSAMVAFADIVVGGESRSLWLPADELPLSWDRAQELLLEDQDFRAGVTDWMQGDP